MWRIQRRSCLPVLDRVTGIGRLPVSSNQVLILGLGCVRLFPERDPDTLPWFPSFHQRETIPPGDLYSVSLTTTFAICDDWRTRKKGQSFLIRKFFGFFHLFLRSISKRVYENTHLTGELVKKHRSLCIPLKKNCPFFSRMFKIHVYTRTLNMLRKFFFWVYRSTNCENMVGLYVFLIPEPSTGLFNTTVLSNTLLLFWWKRTDRFHQNLRVSVVGSLSYLSSVTIYKDRLEISTIWESISKNPDLFLYKRSLKDPL